MHSRESLNWFYSPQPLETCFPRDKKFRQRNIDKLLVTAGPFWNGPNDGFLNYIHFISSILENSIVSLKSDFPCPSNKDKFHKISRRKRLALVFDCWDNSWKVLGITQSILNLLKTAPQILVAKVQWINKWFTVSSAAMHKEHPWAKYAPILKLIHR